MNYWGEIDDKGVKLIEKSKKKDLSEISLDNKIENFMSWFGRHPDSIVIEEKITKLFIEYHKNHKNTWLYGSIIDFNVSNSLLKPYIDSAFNQGLNIVEHYFRKNSKNEKECYIKMWTFIQRILIRLEDSLEKKYNIMPSDYLRTLKKMIEEEEKENEEKRKKD